MAAIIDTDMLAAYLPGITIPPGSATLYVELANDLVIGVVGEQAEYPTRVKAITLEVAARGYRGSDGYTSVTTSFDDTSKTWRRESGSRSDKAGIYLTDAERAELLGLAGKPRRKRARSIRLLVP